MSKSPSQSLPLVFAVGLLAAMVGLALLLLWRFGGGPVQAGWSGAALTGFAVLLGLNHFGMGAMGDTIGGSDLDGSDSNCDGGDCGD